MWNASQTDQNSAHLSTTHQEFKLYRYLNAVCVK